MFHALHNLLFVCISALKMITGNIKYEKLLMESYCVLNYQLLMSFRFLFFNLKNGMENTKVSVRLHMGSRWCLLVLQLDDNFISIFISYLLALIRNLLCCLYSKKRSSYCITLLSWHVRSWNKKLQAKRKKNVHYYVCRCYNIIKKPFYISKISATFRICIKNV